MGDDDADLVRRWRRGDPAAFSDLVRRWQGPIGRFLYHMLERKDQVQDLVQEVFLRVHTARTRYKETASFSTWLYQIALNLARDAGRRRKHEPTPLVNGELVVGAGSLEKEFEEKETAELVRAAVAELPESSREVLVLRHYEDMNFEEISRLTGTPASTLKSRFAVALDRLRTRLESLGVGGD